MNNLTVKQRKMLYAAVAVLAFLPVIIFGAPSSSSGSGGYLAQKRSTYELGESSLGDVDPTSAAMNLVLLGMRGVAASWLWKEAINDKETKQFSQLNERVEQIILLQPHFKGVWEFQAWNLAYNVSAECDDVKDRFHWVKQGAKFMIRGTERNQKVPELEFGAGQFFGAKIGIADEKEVYRAFFKNDPNVKVWKGGPDEDINPEGKDNYLVARDWYLLANETLRLPNVEQHRMDEALFVAYPSRALIDYASAFQKDGVKDELDQIDSLQIDPAAKQVRRDGVYQQGASQSQENWGNAYTDWTEGYGRMRIESSGGGTIILERDDNVLELLAEEDNMTFADKRRWQDRYIKNTVYNFWKRHCEIERREEMTRARYHLIEGRRLYRNVQDFEGARKALEEGMSLLATVIAHYQAEDGSNIMLVDESDTIEEGIKAMLIWRSVMEILGQPIPDEYPLKSIWESPDKTIQEMKEIQEERFLLWQGG